MIQTSELYSIAEMVWKVYSRRTGWIGLIDRQDAIQEAVLYCWQQKDRYDSNKSSPTTFFSMVARSGINMQVQRLRRAKRTVDMPVLPILCDSLIRCSNLAPPEEAQVLEEAELLRQAVDDLPERRRSVILALMNGKSATDLAKEMKVSRARVCQIRSEALANLKLRLPRELDLTSSV